MDVTDAKFDEIMKIPLDLRTVSYNTSEQCVTGLYNFSCVSFSVDVYA